MLQQKTDRSETYAAVESSLFFFFINDEKPWGKPLTPLAVTQGLAVGWNDDTSAGEQANPEQGSTSLFN